ncbi:MAG TPA: hypothetical protein VE758_00785 [Chthoniobacterales bacterium]|nr:hypothetical protein [Chthoniobacterales bacterium]
MKIRHFVLISVFCAALNAFSAEDRPPAVELKHKSSFRMESNGRNPFWPIGFKPTAPTARGTNTGLDIPPNALLLTSITLDQGTHFAIINGKTMQEGQQFTMQVGSETYRLTLKWIQDGQVVLNYQDREIVVPLRRK